MLIPSSAGPGLLYCLASDWLVPFCTEWIKQTVRVMIAKRIRRGDVTAHFVEAQYSTSTRPPAYLRVDGSFARKVISEETE